MVKQLDVSSTPEEMAQAAQSLKQARTAGIVAAIVVGLIGFYLIGSSFGESPWAIIVLVVVVGGAYRLTYEILMRLLPPH